MSSAINQQVLDNSSELSSGLILFTVVDESVYYWVENEEGVEAKCATTPLPEDMEESEIASSARYYKHENGQTQELHSPLWVHDPNGDRVMVDMSLV